MRSRFVAFGLGNLEYIQRTQLDPLPEEVREGQAPEWERLEIIDCKDGGLDDDTGEVEFKAFYRMNQRRVHHELSRFVREQGVWRYKDGDITDEVAPERKKVGRNERCPCGSGKKYKRCCGV